MISIIIVGYNSKKYLKACLSSIYKSTYNRFNVVFVDNNSNDGSDELIEKDFPQVNLIKSKKNLGFAGGNNLGVKKAKELGSKFILLLNPDTIIDANCLKTLAENLDVKTVLQPAILLLENGRKTKLVNTSGGYLNFMGFSYCGQYREPYSSLKSSKPIAVASGAAALMPIKAFQQAGGFDEHFFMYHEDVDLFWRIRLLGYSIRLIPQSVVWHDYSFSRNKQKFFYTERNRLLFLYKNFGIKYRLLILPFFLINELLILCFSLVSGWFPQKMKSYWSAIKLIKIYKSKKLKVIVRKNDLKQFLGPEISFSEVKIPLLAPYNLATKYYWYLIKWAI